ncbi:MAG TPA: UvrD-helicase domain-containing protein [Longimicrobiales bacterium]|nr:UvrD-helicase domain-containing protein [Longimicrobiales bacterium]
MSTVLSLFDDMDENRYTPPRQLVLASAGSGKTFRISSGIIALLARGEAPDDIFASTFTRKAAGEILDRVLLRLATACLDPKEARELAVHAELIAEDATAAAARAYDCAFWSGVLLQAVRRLHRMNIGTLDAFFLRIVSAFGHELGMPADWDIGDETTSARLRSLALQDVLRNHDAGVLLPLIRSITRNPLTRSLHDGLLRKLKTLVAVHYALDPSTDGHWSGFDAEAQGADEAALEQERLRLAARVPALTVPATKAGTPRKHYATNLEKMRAALEAGDWASFLGLGLVKGACATGRFDSLDVPDDILAFIDDAWDVARREVSLRMARRSHALGRFAELYAEALERRRAELGAYEFDDVTRLLGGGDPLGARADLYYRLDAQTKHVLLDEFQDTSVPQWQAIEPLADELLSGHQDERGAIIVADPKQSIYGWRGGTPDLVRHLRGAYALQEALLAKSWRSSQVVLDFVNDVHAELSREEVWGREGDAETAKYTDVARDWLQEFATHAPARDLPGYVELKIGPKDDDPGEARPRLMRRAAEEVARLMEEAPGRSIGVLTRTNAAVARMMLNLKDLGVHASEEGGNALTDAAPVVAILALLRMSDNPGNMVARYHVARSPLGAAIGYTDHTDLAATLEHTSKLRRRLLDDGYGPTITALADTLRNAADARERRRLAQLGELAFRFDSHATLRPSDFVQFVRYERVEDPVAANVRVMTVHQAKGLEFDIVVLPELDAPMVRSRYAEVLAYRPSPGAPVTRAFPFVNKALCALFPSLQELEAAQEQAFRNELRDGLSTMYVALTRAKHALHIVAKPNQGNGRTPARLILRALAPDAEAFAEGDVVVCRGDAGWHEKLKRLEAEQAETSPQPQTPARPTPPLVLRQSTARTRALPRRSPSQLEGGGRVDLGMILRLSPAAARGSIAHRWFQEVRWLEDGTPSDDELRTLAAELQTNLDAAAVGALIGEFRGWLDVPEISQLLRRGRWPGESGVETEVPFMARTGDYMVEGFMDRLVLTRAGGRVVAAAVVDYKTDAVSKAAEVEQRANHYRPQVDAYRRAVAGMYAIDEDAVEGWLVFLEAGSVRRV